MVIVPETNAESPPPYDIVCEPEETRKLGPNEAPVDVPDVDLDVPPPPYNDNDGGIKVHAVIHSEESDENEGQEKAEATEKEEITKSESK